VVKFIKEGRILLVSICVLAVGHISFPALDTGQTSSPPTAATPDQDYSFCSSTAYRVNDNDKDKYRAVPPRSTTASCPLRHRIRCGSYESIREGDRKLHLPANVSEKIVIRRRHGRARALVLYMITSAADDISNPIERNNIEYFMKDGYIPPNTPTALFDSVDFIFAQVQLDENEVGVSSHLVRQRLGLPPMTLDEMAREIPTGPNNTSIPKILSKLYEVAHIDNFRFILAPKLPCDLAAHALILKDYLNISVGDSQGYQQFILFNSGTRGPFFDAGRHPDYPDQPPTTWVDHIAMGGRDVLLNPRYEYVYKPGFEPTTSPRDATSPLPYGTENVLVSAAISFDFRMHTQSFFIGFPAKLLNPILPLFSKLIGGDFNCVLDVEVNTGLSVLGEFSENEYPNLTVRANAAYSFWKNFYVRNLNVEHVNQMKKAAWCGAEVPNNGYFDHPNTAYCYNDPCESVFLKFGGNAWRGFKLQFPDVVNAALKLSQQEPILVFHPYWKKFTWPNQDFTWPKMGPWKGTGNVIVTAAEKLQLRRTKGMLYASLDTIAAHRQEKTLVRPTYYSKYF